jgi:hypothetical protein
MASAGQFSTTLGEMAVGRQAVADGGLDVPGILFGTGL